MNIQNTITYLILAIALGYAVYGLYQVLKPKKNTSAGCSSHCSCDAVKLRKELTANKK